MTLFIIDSMKLANKFNMSYFKGLKVSMENFQKLILMPYKP
jgi:hypothetical protein